MSTITSFDDALSFYPSEGKSESLPRRTLALVRTFWKAFGGSLDAAHRYNQLTARGVQPAEAAARVFDAYYAAR
ncbi:MAG TPA: hypothetical protein VG900_14000 [Hyphomicrobiaceae bacterium]|nr:hypothetical protein [Hyphomicrobiaceae bacterium]